MTSIRLVNNNPMSRLHAIYYYLARDDVTNITDASNNFSNTKLLNTVHDSSIN